MGRSVALSRHLKNTIGFLPVKRQDVPGMSRVCPEYKLGLFRLGTDSAQPQGKLRVTFEQRGVGVNVALLPVAIGEVANCARTKSG